MGDFVPVIIHLAISLLYYSQVQAQPSGYANTPVTQISTFVIPKTILSPTPTFEVSVEGQITNSVGTTFYTWDCISLNNFLPCQFCQAFAQVIGYTFSVDASGSSTYPYTIGESVVPGYVG